jgi:hypothetical protein
VATEIARVLRPPHKELLSVAGNAALVCIAWFLLPAGLKTWLFSRRSPQAFPVVLSAWILADVPATNVLGVDRVAAIAALRDTAAFGRFLWAKQLVLMGLVVPICVLAALLVGAGGGRGSLVAFICFAVIASPFGTLAVACWLGIVFPYHPQSLQWRWQRRGNVFATGRWLALILLPYAIVPFLAGLIIAPGVAILRATSPVHEGLRHPSTLAVIAGCVVVALIAAAFTVIGHRTAVWLARARRSQLLTYLGNPNRG